MDKHDFITRIISLYPHAVKDHNAQYEVYKHALPKSERVDYDQVFEIFCTEHKDSFPPPPGLVSEWARRCIKAESSFGKWVNVRVFNPIYKTVVNTDCFPAGTTEAQMLSFYKKRFPNTDGWRIVEVY